MNRHPHSDILNFDNPRPKNRRMPDWKFSQDPRLAQNLENDRFKLAVFSGRHQDTPQGQAILRQGTESMLSDRMKKNLAYYKAKGQHSPDMFYEMPKMEMSNMGM